MLEKRPFGTLADGTESLCWTLTNAAGLQAEILDCGVTIRSIVVPDQNGKPVDVVLGDDACLPTGEIPPVAGTAMDFRTMHSIGNMVDADEPCLKRSGGYDSNFVLSSTPAVVTVGDRTGIIMTTTTDQPGVQLYTANATGPRPNKSGMEYGYRSAFCLETQHYPDCIHHPDWPPVFSGLERCLTA